jgi:hypothetical protein
MRFAWIFSFFISLLGIDTFGQSNASKFFCQGCCGGVSVYYLKLYSNKKFELYYSKQSNEGLSSTFGFGEFELKNDVYTLSFDNIPEERIELKKVNETDSLIVHFNMFDNIRGESLFLVNIKLENGKKELFYTNSTGTIKARFTEPIIVSFSSLSFKGVNYTFSESGEYVIRIGLNPEGDAYLNQDDMKEFKIVRTKAEEWLQEVGDGNLKFTTKSCKR